MNLESLGALYVLTGAALAFWHGQHTNKTAHPQKGLSVESLLLAAFWPLYAAFAFAPEKNQPQLEPGNGDWKTLLGQEHLLTQLEGDWESLQGRIQQLEKLLASSTESLPEGSQRSRLLEQLRLQHQQLCAQEQELSQAVEDLRFFQQALPFIDQTENTAENPLLGEIQARTEALMRVVEWRN